MDKPLATIKALDSMRQVITIILKLFFIMIAVQTNCYGEDTYALIASKCRSMHGITSKAYACELQEYIKSSLYSESPEFYKEYIKSIYTERIRLANAVENGDMNSTIAEKKLRSFDIYTKEKFINESKDFTNLKNRCFYFNDKPDQQISCIYNFIQGFNWYYDSQQKYIYDSTMTYLRNYIYKFSEKEIDEKKLLAYSDCALSKHDRQIGGDEFLRMSGYPKIKQVVLSNSSIENFYKECISAIDNE